MINKRKHNKHIKIESSFEFTFSSKNKPILIASGHEFYFKRKNKFTEVYLVAKKRKKENVRKKKSIVIIKRSRSKSKRLNKYNANCAQQKVQFYNVATEPVKHKQTNPRRTNFL